MTEACPPVDDNDDDDDSVSAVLLAGGLSTRMGFDKATFAIDGEPLWRRQLRLLQNLRVAAVHISGPAHGPWHGSGIDVIEDTIPQLGPMGALVSILQSITTARVLVLAVDMPAMTVDFLQELLAFQTCIVPKNGDYYEPLVGVYARSDLPTLQVCLKNGQRSLQTYLQSNPRKTYLVTEEQKHLFQNLNQLPL